jgi:hypothetical protein
MPPSADPLVRRRAEFLDAQLTAARTRLRMIAGEKLSFAEEARGLFAVTPDIRPLPNMIRSWPGSTACSPARAASPSAPKPSRPASSSPPTGSMR